MSLNDDGNGRNGAKQGKSVLTSYCWTKWKHFSHAFCAKALHWMVGSNWEAWWSRENYCFIGIIKWIGVRYPCTSSMIESLMSSVVFSICCNSKPSVNDTQTTFAHQNVSLRVMHSYFCMFSSWKFQLVAFTAFGNCYFSFPRANYKQILSTSG